MAVKTGAGSKPIMLILSSCPGISKRLKWSVKKTPGLSGSNLCPFDLQETTAPSQNHGRILPLATVPWDVDTHFALGHNLHGQLCQVVPNQAHAAENMLCYVVRHGTFISLQNSQQPQRTTFIVILHYFNVGYIFPELTHLHERLLCSSAPPSLNLNPTGHPKLSWGHRVHCVQASLPD